jgi:hypothetical protein
MRPNSIANAPKKIRPYNAVFIEKKVADISVANTGFAVP